MAILNLAAQLASKNPESQAQALDYQERLHRLNPGDPHLRGRLLELLIAAGRHADAIPLQEQVVAEAPDNPQALHQLALLYHWQRDYQAAVPLYQKLLDLEASNQALRLEAAKNADAANHNEQALAHYLHLYAQSRGHKEYALMLARLWSQKGQHAEAAAILAPLMDQHPSLEERRRYALELLLAHNYSQALKAYRQAWEAGDSQKDTILNLARLHAQQQLFRPPRIFGTKPGGASFSMLNCGGRRLLPIPTPAVIRKPWPFWPRWIGRTLKYCFFWGRCTSTKNNGTRPLIIIRSTGALSPRRGRPGTVGPGPVFFSPKTLGDAAHQYEQAAQNTGDLRLQLQEAAVRLQLAQNAGDDPSSRPGPGPMGCRR